MEYPFNKIEKKWQKIWQEKKIFKAQIVLKNQVIMYFQCFLIPPVHCIWDMSLIIRLGMRLPVLR